MRPAQALHAYVGAFVDELARAGLRHACIAPGSRSAPLALLFARHPDIRTWMHVDERSAAFFALGLAKRRGEPVALLCTSGTAAANFLPALVEAATARVPLLVLTADRPPELRDVGAPQTIDQNRLFGAQAKWFVEVALPDATTELLRYARTLACRAVAATVAAPAGVVHLNFPFREPLIPEPFAAPVPAHDGAADAWYGRADGAPYVRIAQPPRTLDAAAVQALADSLAAAQRGVIVCGPQADGALPATLGALAARLDMPLLADPLSLARCGDHDRCAVIDAYDALLRDPAVADRFAPDLVLRVGATPTSKSLLAYLQRLSGARQILLGECGWADPALAAAQAVHADARTTCDQLLAALPGAGGSRDRAWLTAWRAADKRARDAIADRIARFDEPFEGRVFAELAELLPDASTLFVSSSMPVRDLDSFFRGGPRRVRFLANRGANGIDGVVSSALGVAAAAAGEDGGPTLLAIGDLAFYHDMNGLLAARLHALDLTIVLLNNDGGGIFSFLPQAAHAEHFEQLFGTPHGLDFRPVAELYGGRYRLAETWPAFRDAVTCGLATPGLSIVEVRTDRVRNVTLHDEVWHAVSAALAAEPTASPL